MESFGLFREDAEDKEQRRLKIKGGNWLPGIYLENGR